ncbi:MAG: GNAT family N-acetyltransferase [Candidatus Thorarchaeota archaeon]
MDDELARSHSIVFEDDGQVRGLGYLDGNTIKRFYVDPAAIRNGVGSTIKDSLEREAVSQGIDHGVLMPTPSSLPFCSSLGYHALEEALAKGGAELRSIRMWNCSSGELL